MRVTSRQPTSIEVAALLRTLRSAVSSSTSKATRGRDLLALVREVKPTQCTLVPVRPGELTSQAGWSSDTPQNRWPVVRQVAARRGHSRQPVRGPGRGCDSLGGRDGGRPRGALHGAICPGVSNGVRGRGGVVRYLCPRRHSGQFVSALASMPGTTWISTICRCSGVCRISPRSRSAMP